MKNEYEVRKSSPPQPHGNTSRALPFHKLEVGDSFEVPPEDFPRTSCARSHFHKRMREQKLNVKIVSRAVRDPQTKEIIAHQFRRVL